MFLLFGGGTGGSALTNSTWTYNGSTNAWTNVTPTVGPSPRAAFGMAYDSRADRSVVFGGLVGTTGMANDTWVFDLANRTWTNVTRGPAPDARTGPSMVYDSAADRLILFGGFNGTESPPDTWSFDLAAGSWTKVGVNTPGGRSLASMVYDSVADRVILFGGYWAGLNAQSRLLNDTWTYNVSTGTWVGGVDTNAPFPRYGMAMAYDPRVQKTILFGGGDDVIFGALYNDTWMWEATPGRWIRLLVAAGPTPRLHPAMDYDPVTDRVYLFGGSLGTPGVSDELWSYQYAPTVPSAPTYVGAVPLNNEIALVWGAPFSDGGTAITDYHVYRSTTPGNETYDGSSGNQYIFYDYQVVNGHTYYYQVTAVNAAGEGPRSAEASGIPVGPPGAPLNLTATPARAQVTLAWEEPVVTGGYTSFSYRVLRGTARYAESNLTILGNVTQYVDANVTGGVVYYYEVTAINPVGESPPSNEVGVRPVPTQAPDAPGSLTANGKRGEIDLAWTAATVPAGAPPVTGYAIYRGTRSGGEVFVNLLGAVLSYRDRNVTAMTTYYYMVAALNSVGVGLQSNEASATPLEVTPPTITITSPVNRTNLTTTTVNVRGNASDDVAVSTVELSTDNVTWTLASGTTSWSGNLTLVDGRANTIYARATDTAGNVRIVSIVVFVNLQTTSPPGVDLLFVAGLSLAVVALVVAVVLVVWATRRRKANRPPEKPPETEPPV